MSSVIATAGPNGEPFGAAAAAAAAVDTEADCDREAAEAAMGLGRGDAEAAASLGVSRFRAESCSRVLTTSRQPLSQLDSRRLTPDRVCTRSGCDTSNDGGSEVDQWTVLCRLSREFRRRIWEFASEVGFRSRVAVEVDRPTGKFRVHEEM